MKKHLLLIAGIVSMFGAVAQTTLTLQPGAATGNDASLGYHDNYNTATQNYGSDIYLKAFCIPGAAGGANSNRGVLQFDLSTIPTNATIVSATLTLYASGYINANFPGHFGTNSATLSRITSAWNEGTVTWNSSPSITTQNQVALPQSTNANQNYINNVSAMVQDMINNPSTSFGFYLALVNENPSVPGGLGFHSSDGANSSLWPKLEVVYTTTSNCLQPDANAGNDASLGYHDNYNTATQNYGGDIYLKAFCVPGAAGGVNSNRGVLSFDLSAIPANSTVQSADLYLYAAGYINANLPGHFGTNVSTLERITAPWTENTVTWNTAPATTTVGAATIPQSTSFNQNYIIDVTTMTQYHVTNPSMNYGYCMRLVTENPSVPGALAFFSSDDANALTHPKLCVTYTDSAESVHTIYVDILQMDVFPNPSTQQVTITTTELNDALVNIYSAEGKLVKTVQYSGIQSSYSIPVGELANGTYIAEILGDNKRGTTKFIKEE